MVDTKLVLPPIGKTTNFVALPVGTVVGRYTITAVLGQGGFGVTYRARDGQLGRDVAIKEYLPTAFAIRHDGLAVLPNSTEAAEDFAWGRQRFVEEGRTLATFEEAPGIVRVYDFLEANGTAYIVMALAQGETLERRLKQGGPLSAPEVDRILHALLAGLAKIHTAGFVHRDIKPANILLDNEGRPTLVDFGAARAAVAGRTAAMTAVFTPGYAAIEQFTDARQGPWTDIYGLSATLYHAIAGTMPPSSIDRTLEDRYRPLATLRPAGFAAERLAGIDRGMAIRPAERPQSTGEWQARLFPAVTAARPGRRTGRTAVFAALAVLMLGAAGGAYILSAPSPTKPPESLQRAASEEQQQRLQAEARAEEETRQRAVAEEARRRAGEAAAAAAAAQAEADARQRAAAEEARRKAEQEVAAAAASAEAEARQRATAEDARRKAEQEAAAAAARAEEEALQRVVAEETRRKDEQEAAAAAVRSEEDARQRAAAEEARRRAEREMRETAAEDAARKAQEEAAAAKAVAERERKAAEAGEAGLRLGIPDRQRLQVALTAQGFDTRGTDGVFGPRTREMVAAWQKARNLASTGFLEAGQQQRLLKEAEAAVGKYEEDQKKLEGDRKSAATDAVAGRWYGVIKDFPPSEEPRRILNIVVNGDKTTCTWDQVGKDNGMVVACRAAGNDLDLTTAAQAKVVLALNQGGLAGTITIKSGRSFAMVMSRTPPPAFDAAPAVPPAVERSATRQTLQTCEQTIAYALTTPDRDVAENIRAFAGVWTGFWYFGLCTALIVENVKSDGSATAVYINGAYVPYKILRGQNRYPARIVGNKLTIDRSPISIEYVMSGTGSLDATYRRPQIDRGRLTRQ